MKKDEILKTVAAVREKAILLEKEGFLIYIEI